MGDEPSEYCRANPVAKPPRLVSIARAFARPLVFMHVPKTAGTSIADALVAAGNAAGLTTCRFLFAQDLVFLEDVRGLGETQLFGGHISTAEIARLIGPASICTFYREPIDRVLSNYFWWRAQHADQEIEVDGAHVRLIDTRLSWEADLIRILNNEERCWKFYELSNIQAYQTAGSLYGRATDPRDALRRAIEAARRFLFVGFHETIATDFAELSRMVFGIRVPLGREKAGPNRPSVAELDPDLRARIVERNLVDVAFFEAMRMVSQRQ